MADDEDPEDFLDAEPLRVRVTHGRSEVAVVVAGDLDAVNAWRFREVVEEVLATRPRPMLRTRSGPQAGETTPGGRPGPNRQVWFGAWACLDTRATDRATLTTQHKLRGANSPG
jgi:hypothetical protein